MPPLFKKIFFSIATLFILILSNYLSASSTAKLITENSKKHILLGEHIHQNNPSPSKKISLEGKVLILDHHIQQKTHEITQIKASLSPDVRDLFN
jgi:hypothetical protein